MKKFTISGRVGEQTKAIFRAIARGKEMGESELLRHLIAREIRRERADASAKNVSAPC